MKGVSSTSRKWYCVLLSYSVLFQFYFGNDNYDDDGYYYQDCSDGSFIMAPLIVKWTKNVDCPKWTWLRYCDKGPHGLKQIPYGVWQAWTSSTKKTTSKTVYEDYVWKSTI